MAKARMNWCPDAVEGDREIGHPMKSTCLATVRCIGAGASSVRSKEVFAGDRGEGETRPRSPAPRYWGVAYPQTFSRTRSVRSRSVSLSRHVLLFVPVPSVPVVGFG